MAVHIDNVCRDQLTQGGRTHLSSAAMRAYSGQIILAQGDFENELITEQLPVVHKITGQVVSYLRPLLSFEDMVSAGTVRFVRATRGFELSHRAEYQIYTYIKIVGALDGSRARSFIPEIVNERIRDVQQLGQKIIQETGAIPNDTKLTERLGVAIDELDETFENARAQHFVSLSSVGDDPSALDNLLVADHTRSPGQKIEQTEPIEKLSEAIQSLNVSSGKLLCFIASSN